MFQKQGRHSLHSLCRIREAAFKKASMVLWRRQIHLREDSVCVMGCLLTGRLEHLFFSTLQSAVYENALGVSAYALLTNSAMALLLIMKLILGGWSEGSVVKNTGCILGSILKSYVQFQACARHLTTRCNSSPRSSNTLSWPPWALYVCVVHAHIQAKYICLCIK